MNRQDEVIDGGGPLIDETASNNNALASSVTATAEILSEKSQPMTYPEGGFKAWSNVLGCFLLSLTSYGQLNAFGVFQTYYAQNQLRNHSASAISWIGSTQLVLTYLSGLVLGRVFDIYGARGLLIAGWLLSTFSIMMTSLSTNYYQIFLSQGVGLGIGIALQFYPLFAVPSHWFRANRAAALGIVVAGSSLSGIIFPIMLSRLLQSIGFGWTVRTLGFLVFALQALAIPLVKERLPHRMGLPLVDHQAYRETTFLLHCTGGFLVAFGYFTPFWYIEIFCLQKGLSPNLSFYMISIMNAAGLIGRVLTGYAADAYGRFNVIIPLMVLSGIASLALWITSQGIAEIVVFSVIFGFTSAAYSSLSAACTAQITSEPSRIGARTGMFAVAMAPGILTGPSIAGAILDARKGNNFIGLQIFVGVVLILGAIFETLARLQGAHGRVKY